eukprot:gene19635-21577_t
MVQEERVSGMNTENTEVDDAMEEIIGKSQAAEEEQGKVDKSKRQHLEMEKETTGARKRCMERLGETRERERSSKKARKNQKSRGQSEPVHYLREKSDKEFDLRKRKMELKKMELAMEERKQALREKK